MLNITCNIDKYEVAKIPNSIGIIAYSGKDWRNNLLLSTSKLVFLLKTVASTSSYVTETHVYHPADENLDFIKDYFANVFTHGINPPMETDNDNLIHPIGKYAMLEKRWDDFDYVFFNEGDQVIFSKNLSEYINCLDDSNYLSPHRLERDFNKSNSNNQPIVIHNNIKYVLYNLPKSRGEQFFKCKTFWESYGAAWIAKKESVNKADFTRPGNSSLHVPCLSMFNAVEALKTSNCWNFFVDHLSGYNNALSKEGYDIEALPNCW
jgi:hypothetical protein